MSKRREFAYIRVSTVADELRLEGAQTVAGDFNGEFSEVALEGFVALAVPGIADGVSDGSML